MKLKADPSNVSTFKISREVLASTLIQITKAFGRSRKNFGITLELTVTDGLLSLVSPGVRFELPCETASTVKATLGLFYFTDVIKHIKDDIIEGTFSDDCLTIDKLKLSVLTTFFQNDRILRSIKLPINYTDRDLLRLSKEGYTYEEIMFNKLHIRMDNAHETLERNITGTFSDLKVYGVKFEDLDALVRNAIYK